ncbi:MAG: GNAT family N-acetyltransferase [Peptostreptococcaceae bacterium]
MLKKERTRKALQKFIIYLEKTYEGEFFLVPSDVGGTVAIVSCNKFDIAITVCLGYRNKWCIKIEELIVHEKYRNKGIASELLDNIKILADVEKVKVGFWVRKSRKDLLEFYLKRGFVVKETVDDLWLEYN